MPAPVLLLLTVLLGAPLTARADDVIVLLEARSCPSCKLDDADLIQLAWTKRDLGDADPEGQTPGRRFHDTVERLARGS